MEESKHDVESLSTSFGCDVAHFDVFLYIATRYFLQQYLGGNGTVFAFRSVVRKHTISCFYTLCLRRIVFIRVLVHTVNSRGNAGASKAKKSKRGHYIKTTAAQRGERNG